MTVPVFKDLKSVYFIFERLTDNTYFVLGNNTWGLTFVDGLASPEISVFSRKNAFGDGEVITSKRLGKRELTIKAINLKATTNNTERAKALRFFTPKADYKITINYMGRKLYTFCSITGLDLPQEKTFVNTELVLMLLCPDPYLYDTDRFGKDLAQKVNLFNFPLNVYSNRSASYKLLTDKALLANDSDKPAEIELTIKCRGDVTNPTITKDRTGQYVKILGNFVDDDEIYINFKLRKVLKNGGNIFNQIDKGSSFFTIPVGGAYVTYSADIGRPAMNVFVFYDRGYLGI